MSTCPNSRAQLTPLRPALWHRVLSKFVQLKIVQLSLSRALVLYHAMPCAHPDSVYVDLVQLSIIFIFLGNRLAQVLDWPGDVDLVQVISKSADKSLEKHDPSEAEPLSDYGVKEGADGGADLAPTCCEAVHGAADGGGEDQRRQYEARQDAPKSETHHKQAIY